MARGRATRTGNAQVSGSVAFLYPTPNSQCRLAILTRRQDRASIDSEPLGARGHPEFQTLQRLLTQTSCWRAQNLLTFNRPGLDNGANPGKLQL